MPPKSEKNWIQEDLRKLKTNTIVLTIVVLSTLGVLLGYYLFSDSFKSPFRNVSYAYEGSEMHIKWETRFPARVRVEYGTSEIYLNETDLTDGLNTSHEIGLRGLLPETPHFFRLIAEDNTGQKHISSFFSANH